MHSSSFGYTHGRIVLDAAGHPIDYEILDINETYAATLGMPIERVIGKKITEILPDIRDDPFDWIGAFGNVALGGEKTEFEEYSQSLGKWYHISVHSPEKGQFFSVSFDITERKDAVERLRQSERQKRIYLDSAPDGIFITNENRRYVDVNPAGCAMSGYTREELTNLHIRDLIPTDETSVHLKSMGTLTERGRSSRRGRLLRKDGISIPVIFDTVKLEDGKLMTFCKDVSREEATLLEKERYFHAFESIAQPIVITDDNGVILSINSALSELYGYTREEAIGKDPHVLNPGKKTYENLGVAQQEYENRFKELWAAVRDPARRKWEGVVINRKKDGSLIWVNLVVNGVYDENGKLSSIIGIPIDITHSRELEFSRRIELYRTIADLAELRDDETGNHMKRVGIFAKLLARAYGMNEKFCEDIEIFAPMHDIGKVGILDSILRAPRKLTPSEFAVMKTHTVLGHNIVRGKQELEIAAEVTLCHHERFDGTGYPNRLVGSAIPISARITSLADVYDALRSERPYKRPWPREETEDYIAAESGKQFDPKLVELFISLKDHFDSVYAELAD